MDRPYLPIHFPVPLQFGHFASAEGVKDKGEGGISSPPDSKGGIGGEDPSASRRGRNRVGRPSMKIVSPQARQDTSQ
jgi:hypothetical protein